MYESRAFKDVKSALITMAIKHVSNKESEMKKFEELEEDTVKIRFVHLFISINNVKNKSVG